MELKDVVLKGRDGRTLRKTFVNEMRKLVVQRMKKESIEMVELD